MYQFKVEGLHCGSCADGLEEALKGIDSKGTIETNLDEEKIKVTTSASLEVIKRMIEEAGYPIVSAQKL